MGWGMRASALIWFLLVLMPLLAKSKEVALGEKAYSRGSYDAARKHFQDAIEQGDESGDPRLYIGLILESHRQYAESIPYFRAAADRPMQKKFKKVAYWKLVILYRQARQYPEALRYVERLEEIGEKSDIFEKIRDEAGSYSGGGALRGYAEIKRAGQLEKELAERQAKKESLEDMKELVDSIISTYQQAIVEDGRWADYRWKIASYQEKLKYRAAAQATYARIWDESADPGAAYKLGIFARKSGDYQKSLKYFAAALEKPIEDPQLKFYIRLNAARAHYGLGHYADSYTHARVARQLAADLELKKRILLSLRRIYCLARISTKEDDPKYCLITPRVDGIAFHNLFQLKKTLAAKNVKKAADFASKIFDNEATDDDESEGKLPAYGMSDLPVAIGTLFKAERYAQVLEITEKFHKTLSSGSEYYGWRAVSYFALKEYGSASIEFEKIKKPSVSQMNLHLMALAQISDIAGLKAKAGQYLKDKRARGKLVKNLRRLRIYAPLREEPDFERWLEKNSHQVTEDSDEIN
jgi:tetratricopeptide (TPR) repeat protein